MAADPKEDDESIVLPIKVRRLAGAVALVLLTFCVILVWRGREGGAVIALVVTGGVAGLLALVGTLPSRLIVGGNEAHWRRRFTEEKEQRKTAEAEVEAVADELSPEELQRAAERAATEANAAVARARHQSTLSEIAKQRARLVGYLRSAAEHIGAEVDTEPAMAELPEEGGDVARKIRPDFAITRGNRRVLVELKRTAHPTHVEQFRMIALAHSTPMLLIAKNLNSEFYEDADGQTIFGTCPTDPVAVSMSVMRMFRTRKESSD